jgi:hypothetical protein
VYKALLRPLKSLSKKFHEKVWVFMNTATIFINTNNHECLGSALALKYISARKRPDLQPKLLACLTYPFYQQLHAAVSILGAVRTVMVFIGRNERKMNVREMIEANDQRVIWKDPRFESNLAFLADEGEALKRSSIESQNSESGLVSDGTK